jgi:hypothetical protein
MGAPLLANYQSALLYPPNWFLLLLYEFGGTPMLAWGETLIIAFHLIWAGTGMALLARRLGLNPLAQAVCGLSYGLSGYMVARSSFLSINAAASWVPWVMLAILATTDEPMDRKRTVFSFIPIPLTLAICFQLLAGHAQTTWYTLLLSIIWAGYWGWHCAREADLTGHWRSLFGAIGRYAIACLIASLLAAIQLLPTGEYLIQSQREGGLDMDFALTYSFSPWRLVTLLAPDFYGNPRTGNFWGYATYWEDAIYIGLPSILLALGALFFVRWHPPQPDHEGHFTTIQPSLKNLLTAVIFMSLLLALGKNTPVYPWLYQNIPTFDMFQAPARFTLWAEFALVLLAGFGVQRWQQPRGRGLYWSRLGLAGALAMIPATLLTPIFAPQANPTAIKATVLAGIWASGVGILNLTAPAKPERKASGVWAWAVILILLADLLIAHYNLLPPGDSNLYRSPSPALQELRQSLGNHRLYIGADDEYEIKFKRFFRFDTFNTGEDWLNIRRVSVPNTNLLDGLASANNFDPLVPSRYARWMESLEAADLSIRQRLFELMDVSLVERPDPSQSSGVDFSPTHTGKRIRWAPCAAYAKNGEEAWQLLQMGTEKAGYFDRYVILEGMHAVSSPPCSEESLPEEAIQILQETSTSMVIELNTPLDGWLVVSDVWYPGWRAAVDGEATPVLRANFLFRAVSLPAGEHQVVFEYHPSSFTLGATLSVIAWLALGILAYLQRGYS